MAYIETTIGIKADELQSSLREISTNVQIAFDVSQRKLDTLFNEATANAIGVDSQVQLVNDLKASIELKIVQHETAIVASGQSADGAHARLTALMVELEGFSGSTQTAIAEVKSAGDTTRKEIIEEFAKFRESMEL